MRIGSTAVGPDLVARVITRSPVVLCAAPAYLAERGVPLSAEDLPGHDRLHFAAGGATMNWLVKGASGAPQPIVGAGRIVADSAEAIRDLALAGFGIAELPSFLVDAHLASGALVPILSEHAREPVAISVLYANRRHLPARVRLFIDRLASEIHER